MKAGKEAGCLALPRQKRHESCLNVCGLKAGSGGRGGVACDITWLTVTVTGEMASSYDSERQAQKERL